MSLELNAAVTVAVGSSGLGTWTTKSGGQVEADDVKFRPGGMQPQVALGGPVSVENVTVSRMYDATLQGQIHSLMSQVGLSDMTIAHQPLDAQGNPVGKAIIYRGKLNRVTPPDVDANGNDVAMVELEMSAHGSIA